MDKFDIKAQIRRSGSSLTAISKALTPPVSITAVAKVIDGTGKSRRIAEKISSVTGKTLDEMWPEKYKSKDAA